jgi:hypothetical protein
MGSWDRKFGTSESLIWAFPAVTQDVPGVALLQAAWTAPGTVALAAGEATIATAAAPAASSGAT